MSIALESTAGIIYDDECMLAGWGDTSDKGQWVRLWLDADASLHPFAGYKRRGASEAGDYFAAAFVLTTEPGGPAEAVQSRGRKPSQHAFLLIGSSRFRQWMEERNAYTKTLEKKGRRWDPETIKRYVKYRLQIESLSELDRGEDVLRRFNSEFREPFMLWSDR